MRWRRRERRVVALRPKLSILYQRPMDREDTYDAALTVMEGLVRGDFRLVARDRPRPELPEPWRGSAKA